MTKNLGMLLLGIWLIVTGLIPLLYLGFSGLGTLMAIGAVVAGALILVGRQTSQPPDQRLELPAHGGRDVQRKAATA